MTRAALDHDPFDRLADALMEDIAAVSGDDLLGEVEKDFGDAGVLAVAFDEVLAGAEALVLRQSVEDPIGNLAIGNLADALCDDIAATPPEALLREAAEDYGDARALAAGFDRALAGGDASSVAMDMAGAGTLSGAEEGRRAVTPAAGRSPASLTAACATALDWLTAPLRSRTAIAAFAALLLVAVLAPGIHERYAERIAATSEYAAPGPPMARPVASVSPVQGRAPAGRELAGSELQSPSQSPPDVKQDAAAAPPSGAGAGAGEQPAAPREIAEHQDRRESPALRGRSQEALRPPEERQRQETPQQEALQQEAAATEGLRTLELRRLTQADQKRRAAGEAGPQRPAVLDQQRKAEQERQETARQETERQETERQAAAVEPQPKKAPPALQRAEPPASGPAAPQAARPAPAPMARLHAPATMAQPAPAPPRVIANLPEQIRQAQVELNRLGCLKGPSDGQLSDETRKAVKAFLTRAAGAAVEAAITDELIAGLRLQPNGVCRGDAPAVTIRLPETPGKALGTGF